MRRKKTKPTPTIDQPLLGLAPLPDAADSECIDLTAAVNDLGGVAAAPLEISAAPEVLAAPIAAPIAAAPADPVPFARSWVVAVKALPLSDAARAALDPITAKVFGRAVFAALPAPVRAELVAIAKSRAA